MTLTAEGEKLVKPVNKALDVLAVAIDGLRARAARQKVRLGFLPTLGEQTVPLLLRRFAEISPLIKFSLVQDSADQLLRYLHDGQVELCLIAPLPEPSGLEIARLGLQRLVLAVPAQHILANEADTPLTAAASDDFVTLEPGNHMRQLADDLCQSAGFEPRITFEAAGVTTVRGLVAAGLGVAIVPQAPAPVAGLVEVPLTDAGAYREVGLAWPTGAELTEPAREFRQFVVDHSATILGDQHDQDR
jgi:DNA-binding transcriptional LysR family regulator